MGQKEFLRCFFFQAEDGIRDIGVTGVQTCALPILLRYAGLRCRILGTFLLRRDERGEWPMAFGPDLANFYSGRGMKVYKPDERSEERRGGKECRSRSSPYH